MKSAVVVPRSSAQSARKLLEETDLWDKTRRLQKQDKDTVAIPVLTTDVSLLAHCLQQEESCVSVIHADLPPSKVQSLVTPSQQLLDTARELLKQYCIPDPRIARLLQEVPSHWEKHGDLVLLPANSFASQEWCLLGQELWRRVAGCVGAKRVARQAVVSADDYRSPQVELVLGHDGVVQHLDNGIRYEYDITKCMFSAGNITEKLRIATFSCQGETVVDLYAGIGYFTLPYLVHAGASHVHACEWNPDAVTALERNLKLNNVHLRCTVHPGDNRQLKLSGIADRINLGLIPSSEDGWPVACCVLKPTGGVMHVHGNVNSLTAVGEKLQSHLSTVADGLGQAVQDHESHSVLHQHCLPEEIPTQGTPSNNQGIERPSSDTLPEIAHPNNLSEANSDSRNEPSVRAANNKLQQPKNSMTCTSYVHRSGGSSNQLFSSAKCVESKEVKILQTSSQSSHTSEHSTYSLSVANELKQTEDCQCDGILSSSKNAAWQKWGESVCTSLKTLLEKEKGGEWYTEVTHIEPVKSYAPRVHHVVLDVRCAPVGSP